MQKKTTKRWPKKKTNKELARSVTSKDCSSIDDKTGYNDLSWYVIDDQILNDSARIPYSIPVGMPYNRDGLVLDDGIIRPSYDEAMPGILVSHLMPILGNAHNAADAVNVAANSIYQFVRSEISGSRPYDAVDFMIYLGAMDSVFTYCTWLTRAYATVFTYHQANRYLSRALLEAQGIDYDDLVANLSSFRQRFNVLIAKVKSLYVPANMSIFKRHSWMFSNYYIEGESEKDQIYMHVPEGYYIFDKDDAGAGMLSAQAIDNTNKLSASDLIDILNYMLDPIYDDEDFNKISGDLLKAYEGNVFTITEIPDIATVTLKYQEEVLLQFKNAKYCMVNRDQTDNGRFMDDAFNYYQDANKRYLTFTMPESALSSTRELKDPHNELNVINASSTPNPKMMFKTRMMNFSKPTLLTSPHRDVAPGENMINTRLTISLNIDLDGNSYWGGTIKDIAVGTEWPVRYTIHTYHRSKATQNLTLFWRAYDFSCYLDSWNPRRTEGLIDSQIPILSAFKYHPELFIDFYSPSDEATTTPVHVNAGRSIFDVDNYAFVDFNIVQGLHNAAILGQFNVPKLSLGK